MNVALVQMRVVPGNLEANVRTMFREIERCERLDFDVVAFPELCLGGYLVGDLWYDSDWIDEHLRAQETIRSRIETLDSRIHVIFGGVRRGETGERNQDGRDRLYNTAVLLRRTDHGYDVVTSDKTLLPNYRFFDDKRYFSPGGDKKPIEIELRDGTKTLIGIEVCEDLWHDDYPIDPTEQLCRAGVEWIFNVSASPYSYNKRLARDRVIARTLSNLDSHRLKAFFYVNCVGSQNNGKNVLTFDGDSGIFDAQGRAIVESDRFFEEDVLEYRSDRPVVQAPVRTLSKVEFQYAACLEGIRHLDQSMGSSFPYVVGLSGGIDSAVVACLIERAVGKDRLKVFNLPSRYNSERTKDNARLLARELGIPLGVIPIDELANGQIRTLQEANLALKDLHVENVQAKIRGTSILSNVAGILGGVMTNNGNKVEIALGYATLYGDVNGAIAPIGDLLKTEVWELGRYLNERVYGKETIAWNLIPDPVTWAAETPPSAELKSNQVDPMKWGYHDALTAYLLNYKRGSVRALTQAWDRSPQEAAQLLAKATDFSLKADVVSSLMERYGLTDRDRFRDDLKWFVRTMQAAVFKRIQAPPIVVQSKAAYGYDVRESQLRWDRSILSEVQP